MVIFLCPHGLAVVHHLPALWVESSKTILKMKTARFQIAEEYDLAMWCIARVKKCGARVGHWTIVYEADSIQYYHVLSADEYGTGRQWAFVGTVAEKLSGSLVHCTQHCTHTLQTAALRTIYKLLQCTPAPLYITVHGC